MEKHRSRLDKIWKGIKLLTAFMGMIVPVYLLARLQQSCINQWKDQAEKNKELFLIMDQWTNIKQEGKGLEEYFIKNNYQKIAIYGMDYIGCRLVKELRETQVEITYGIDSNRGNVCPDIPLLTVRDDLLNVDAVVIAALGEFDSACDMLSMKLDCPMIAIEDILNEI